MTCDDIKECCRSSENKKCQDWWNSWTVWQNNTWW